MGNRKRLIVILLIATLAILIFLVFVNYQKANGLFQNLPREFRVFGIDISLDHNESGTIIFQRVGDKVDGKFQYEYFIMDGNGNQVQFLSTYHGMPAWSPDGKFFAVSCEDDVGKICLVDTQTIPDLRKFPYKGSDSYEPKIAKKIQLPNECQELISDDFGLQSISWSRDGKKIAVVCNGNIERINEKLLCILNQYTKETSYWEDYPYIINNALWSPVEDILLISTSEVNEDRGVYEHKIFLVEEDKTTPIFLTEGIGGAWSPDGKRIAFTHIELDEIYSPIFSGIGSIAIDGTD